MFQQRANFRKRGKGRKPADQLVRINPPAFQPTILITKVWRFQVNSSIVPSAGVTINLLDCSQMFAFGVSTTSVVSVFEAWRIKSIEIWGPASPGNTVAFEYAPGIVSGGINPGGPGRVVSDTSMGVSVAPHVVQKPPKTSLAGMWNGVYGSGTPGNTQVVYLLSAPAMSIIDIKMQFSLLEETTGTPLAVTSATANVLQLRALAGSNLIPVSYVGYTP